MSNSDLVQIHTPSLEGTWPNVPTLDAALSGQQRPGPEALAKAFLASVSDSGKAIIQAAQIVNFTMKLFGPNTPERTTFCQSLVAAGFLSKQEARAEGQSSKLSKLSTLGEYAPILLRPEILSRISPGYSTYYEAVQLYRVFEGKPDDLHTMSSVLEEAGGEANREFLKQKAREYKRERDATNGQSADAKRAVRDAPSIRDIRADLVLLTPSAIDQRRFDQGNEAPDGMCGAYNVDALIAPSAVGVCVTCLRDYPMVASRVLPLSGFKFVQAIYLLEQPTLAEVSDAEIAVVATRTRAQSLPNVDHFFNNENRTGIALALQLAPAAKSRLHVFASEAAPDWTALGSDEAWSIAASSEAA